MKTIAKTEHICSNCLTNFQAASLGDFTYGEFLLWSSTEDCLYLNAFDDETYQEVIDLIEKNKEAGVIQATDTSLLLQEIYGELACDTDGFSRPYHMNYPPCPNCGSTSMALVGDRKVGEIIIGTVTHKLWNLLAPQDKETRLINVLRNRGKMRY